MTPQPVLRPTETPLADDDPERGDVPGWVLVTMMTAGLVVLLWAAAGPALTTLFKQAIEADGGKVAITGAGKIAFPKLAARSAAYRVSLKVSVTENGQIIRKRSGLQEKLPL